MTQSVLSYEINCHIRHLFGNPDNCKLCQKPFDFSKFCLVMATNKQFHLSNGTYRQCGVFRRML